MNKIKYIAAALIAVAGLGLQHAKADTFSYTLTTGNSPSLGAGPFGTVLVNRTASGSATITFTAAAGYLFVDGGAVAVNVNAVSWTVSPFTVNAGANPVTNDSPRQEDGFGIFNQGGSQANSSLGASSVSFTLTAAPSTWSTAANVLVGNALGNAVAAHIQIASGPSQGVTGFVTGPGTPSVPDGGATVMLLGMAFGALGMVRRYLVS
jgi:hypothetical protein